MLGALIAGLVLIPAGRVVAQNFTTLYTFTNGSDGNRPSGLVLSGNTLYGATELGGPATVGTVFALGTNGTNFAVLYTFTNGSDGAEPLGDLILSGNLLYGTALYSGILGFGTVFAINTNGTGFNPLYSFGANIGSDGGNPAAGVILSGNTLYGTTYQGGSLVNGVRDGTVFAVNTNGTGYTDLYSFSAGTLNSSGTYTNSDGSNPEAGLLLSGMTLYGTTQSGGTRAGHGVHCQYQWHELYESAQFFGQRRCRAFCPIGIIRQHALRHDLYQRQRRRRHGIQGQYRWHRFLHPA